MRTALFLSPLSMPTCADLLADLGAYSFAETPMFVSPPCAHFSLGVDFDELAQDVVEGRHRHRPRNVFAPNQFATKMRRK
ncbi:hypothetical protein RHIZ_06255 [Rhizobium skierniewicense]|uniref:hypothetical protein n=1 Tax=Rhizobium skierniewicense TaxID=984260 RepID=UPI001FABC5ED|nr:hypothetical protein [Rhizobium skierniewicense]MCI9865543.1 hypothetical protein [Rhizobium skierniewicense]